MSIQLNDNIYVAAPKPIDQRMVKTSETDRDTIPNAERYVGLEVLCIDTFITFIWDGSAWDEYQNTVLTDRKLYDDSGNLSLDWQNRVLVADNGNTTVDWENCGLRNYNTGELSVDFFNNNLYTDGIVSLQWGIRNLNDSTSVTSIDWGNRSLYDSNNLIAMSWDSGNRLLYGNSADVSMDWNNRTSIDENGTTSIDWDARLLYNDGGNISIDWNDRLLYNDNGNVVLSWANNDIYDNNGVLAISFGANSGSGRALSDYNGVDCMIYGTRSLLNIVQSITLDWQNSLLISNNSNTSVDWQNKKLFDNGNVAAIQWSTSVINDQSNNISIDWNNRNLYTNTGKTVIQWNNLQLRDNTGAAELSVDWGNRNLYHTDGGTITLKWSTGAMSNTSSVVTANWFTQILNDTSGNVTIDWQNKILKASTINVISWATTGMSTTYSVANSSGSVSSAFLTVSNTINQTGSYSGINRSIYINPTITSVLSNSQYRAIEMTNATGYGIYQSGAAINTFAGNVGIGTSTPTGLLHVARAAANGAGTVTITNSSTTVTGSGTSFLSVFAIGDTIVANGETHVINSITSDTVMGTTSVWAANLSGISYTYPVMNRFIMSTNGGIANANILNLTIGNAGNSGVLAFARSLTGATITTFTQGSSDLTGNITNGSFIVNSLTSIKFGTMTNSGTPGANAMTSGSYSQLSLLPIYNQVSATTANTDLLINRTETSVGSGTQKMLDLQVASTSLWSVSNKGKISMITGTTSSSVGHSTMVGGTVTVSNTIVTSNSLIYLTVVTDGGTIGNLTYTITAGTSFTINSSNILDTSTVNWFIIN